MPASRLLLPREYGAYAQLGFPLSYGLIAGGVTAAGLAFAGAAIAGLLAYEPLAIQAGARGERLRRALAGAARRRAWILGIVGTVLGGTALWLAPPAARRAAIVPAALAALVMPAVVRGTTKTLVAELTIAASFATMVPPVSLSGRLAPAPAWTASGVWLAAAWLATLAVHAIKARAKPELRARWTVWGAPIAAVAIIGTGGLLALFDVVDVSVAAAPWPAALVTLGAILGRVHPRRLRRVGWSLAAGSVVTLALLLGAT